MSEVVMQRTPTDCVLCCLALLVRRSYEEVVAALGELGQKFVTLGADHDDDLKALETLGFKQDRDFMRLMVMPEYVSQGFLRNILWGRRALIGVKSNSKWGQFHAVYFDGKELLDPSATFPRESLSQIEPIDLIIFNEAKP